MQDRFLSLVTCYLLDVQDLVQLACSGTENDYSTWFVIIPWPKYISYNILCMRREPACKGILRYFDDQVYIVHSVGYIYLQLLNKTTYAVVHVFSIEVVCCYCF